MKSTSCGVLMLCASRELLLCHATGTPRWDIPKGIADPGEREVDAALREAREECGIGLAAGDLHELGRHAYRRDKDLYLFTVLIERIDTGLCTCSSLFEDRFGRMQPEMDGFRWVAFADIGELCAANMALLLTQKLSLESLCAELVARGPAVAPVFGRGTA